MIYILNSDDCEKVPKNWGEEIILHNSDKYCGKLLRFNRGAKFSMHFHILKEETWYINKGEFQINYINPENADKFSKILTEGMVIEIEKGNPHQLIALTDGEIFEVSTQHFDDDSYRIEKGDSQS
jgi:mannose-6-phosphate isomerase-like protein (cupin superfamily)